MVTGIAPIRAFLGANEEGWNWVWDIFFDELEMTEQQFLTMDQVESNKKVALFTDNEQDGICLVEVNVEPPGKSWPELSNYKVDLALRTQTESAVTDEWGTAVFPTVPLQYLGTMRLQVSF